MINLRALVANSIVVLVSLVFGILVCEAGSRMFLNPADYLSVTTNADDVLGISIAPGSAGLDDWGFRNASVPSSADVVTVGDSHTFGNAATMDDAWPNVLSRETGLQVYNLGIGGYGPNQYYHLLKTKGMSLHPKWVLCGLYMGDDFENAFSITYGLDYWKSLRGGGWKTVDANIWADSEPPGAFKSLRNWLSRESMVYRLVVHGAVIGALKESIRFRQVAQQQDPAVTAVVDESQKIREAFRPIGIAQRLNQSRGEIKEGMRIAFTLLKQMDELCRENGCRFAVVIIPTKETVFADYLNREPSLHLKDAVDRVITNENEARQKLGEFLDASQIPYIDTLPALKAAVGQQLYAPTTADMHPGRNGYRVIGDAVSEWLKRHRS